MAKISHDQAFKPFHLFCIWVSYMIKADQMQNTVNNQMGCMGIRRNSLVRRFADAGFIGKNNIAQHNLRHARLGQSAQRLWVDHWEGQDVGGLILLAIGAVEDVNLGIARQADRDFNGRIDVGKGAVRGQANGTSDRRLGSALPGN